MTRPNIPSIIAVSFLFCGLSGAFPPSLHGAGTPESSPQRPDIVGGTDFPDLYHHTDPVTRSEVWGVRPPKQEQEESPAPPIIVSPEIYLSPPAPRGGEAGYGGARP